MTYFATVLASGKDGTTHLLTVELDRSEIVPFSAQLNQAQFNFAKRKGEAL